MSDLKPTGTHAVNATISSLQALLLDYDALRVVRDAKEPSTAQYTSAERRLAGMRRQATKLIDDQLAALDARVRDSWKRAFGLI